VKPDGSRRSATIFKPVLQRRIRVMAKFTKTILLTLVIVGGVYLLLYRDQLQHPGEMVTQLKETARRNWSAVQASFRKSDSPAGPPAAPVIRIATFKLQASSTTLNGLSEIHAPSSGQQIVQANRLRMLAEICSRYDVIALQGIAGGDDSWLQMLMMAMNETGPARDYYFITDANQLRGDAPVAAAAEKSTSHATTLAPSTQNAIVFNRLTLEMDYLNWYTVHDPDGLLKRSPLVAWFRVRVPDQTAAFTFTLANLEMSAHRPDLELAYLGDLFRAIRNDGRGEDDVILAGDFNACDRGLGTVEQRSGLMHVISGSPTDIRRSGQFDNLVFSPTATQEFTGNGGTYDFLRAGNLSLDEAEQLSRRMPVWAEFSIFEGGQ